MTSFFFVFWCPKVMQVPKKWRAGTFKTFRSIGTFGTFGRSELTILQPQMSYDLFFSFFGVQKRCKCARKLTSELLEPPTSKLFNPFSSLSFLTISLGLHSN